LVEHTEGAASPDAATNTKAARSPVERGHRDRRAPRRNQAALS
jgi:hypothetical protein